MYRDEFDELDQVARMEAVKSGVQITDRPRLCPTDEVLRAVQDALEDNWPLSGGDGNEFDCAVGAVLAAITPFLKTEALELDV